MVAAIEASHLAELVAEMWRWVGSSSSVGRPTVLGLQFGDRPLDVAGPAANRPRNPVELAQSVVDRAADPWRGEGLELHASGRIEPLDRVDEPEHPGADQVAGIDAGRQAGTDTAGDELDQR